MKSRLKVLLLGFALMLSMFLLGACSTETKHDLNAQELAQIETIPQSLIGQIATVSDEELLNAIQQLQKSGAGNEATGLQNFYNARSEIGEIQEVFFDNVEGSKKEGYLLHGHIDGSMRKSAYTVGLDKDMQLISLSFAPEYTIDENMVKAGLNTILGMGTVFVVLIFIAFIIGLLKYVNAFGTSKTNQTNTAQFEKPVEFTPSMRENVDAHILPTNTSNELSEDKQLVAVITAAICAYTGQNSDGLIVRSIRRMTRKRR